MLEADALRVALDEAVRAAGACRSWCRHGAELGYGGYHIWHNGAGSDTADQRVYADDVLGYSEQLMTARLCAWVKRLHRGVVEDLNLIGRVG